VRQHDMLRHNRVTYSISARKGVFLNTNFTLLSTEDLVYSCRGGEIPPENAYIGYQGKLDCSLAG